VVLSGWAEHNLRGAGCVAVDVGMWSWTGKLEFKSLIPLVLPLS
jgi:hypothetical protein